MGILLDYYMSLLDYSEMPKFMQKYLNSPSLRRLKNIGYFCGMDYASKEIYDFSEKITRFDHSVSVALLVYKFTHNREKAIAGLFHDVGSPCFCHVIDYMNGDHATQESTEEFTSQIIMDDNVLVEMLASDSIAVEDVINYKKFSIVDNQRPRLCADRLDGIILTGISWLKCVTKQDIFDIIANLRIYRNEDNVDELGFADVGVAQRVYDISHNIDLYCHSKEDNYMMELLAKITRLSIEQQLFSYEDLFYLSERDVFSIIDRNANEPTKELLNKFRIIHKSEIPNIDMPYVKNREINPLVKGKRLLIQS